MEEEPDYTVTVSLRNDDGTLKSLDQLTKDTIDAILGVGEASPEEKADVMKKIPPLCKEMWENAKKAMH